MYIKIGCQHEHTEEPTYGTAQLKLDTRFWSLVSV